jgi:glycosyltransferase involved in cell wall biosynthesis
MAPHYDRDRFSVTHCNLFDETGGAGPFPAALKATGLPLVEIAGCRSRDVLRIVRQLRKMMESGRTDVLHLHMARATIVGGLASLFNHHSKVLVSKHYRYASLRGRGQRMLDRLFTNRADAVAAVSKAVRGDLVRHGASAEKVRVVHNGIDLHRFDERTAQVLSPDIPTAEGPLLGCFGSLHPLKGHEFLFRAMPAILRAHRSARLLLVGEGTERDRLHRLARSLGIEHAVTMTGFHENVPAVMRRVDLCVHPSIDEAFGLVLLEAMAAGKAIVASAVGGVGEIVADGDTGVLVPPRNPDALAGAICTLLDDADARERMGQAGRARVEAEFTIEQTVRSYESLYGELIAP